MSAEYFLDTNVLVYAFDRKDERKRTKALEIMMPDKPWMISWQIIQEFCSVALHRFAVPLTTDFLVDFLDVFLLPHCQIYPDNELYRHALKIHQDTHYRYYDCLVVAAAMASGTRILYTEDMQHGRNIGDLVILNPFV